LSRFFSDKVTDINTDTSRQVLRLTNNEIVPGKKLTDSERQGLNPGWPSVKETEK